jgi:hypothetical protein
MLKKIFKTSNDKSKVATLTSMGFNATQAKHALEAFDGNLERATNYLLSEQDDQSQLQNAMEQSVAVASATSHRKPDDNGSRSAGGRPKPSAASLRAGQAAATRAENASRRFGANGKLIAKKQEHTVDRNNISNITSSSYPSNESSPFVGTTTKKVIKNHPNVKMPTQMKDKSKEEQILRCAQRLAPHPFAVDTLLRAFTFIRKNPNMDKYRKIDRSTNGFQSSLQGKPGAVDLIYAMNFESRAGPTNDSSSDLILRRSRVDDALLYLGISALEEIRKSEEYISSKQSIAFEKELKQIQNGQHVSEDEEILKRAALISKLPSEPSSGAGTLVQISLGEEKIMRRFDGDDILKDVIHFIGTHGSAIPEKIKAREWCLVDMNQYPVVPIDTDDNMHKTLQYIGCWPSGKLALKPSSTEWRVSKVTVVKAGSSRGLGAGPKI